MIDQDVDDEVRSTLVRLGHEAWTAEQAGMAAVKDDELTVYAGNRKAALMTHDREFSTRRRKYPLGQHIWLHCLELNAADLVEEQLPKILELLRPEHVFIEVSPGKEPRATY